MTSGAPPDRRKLVARMNPPAPANLETEIRRQFGREITADESREQRARLLRSELPWLGALPVFVIWQGSPRAAWPALVVGAWGLWSVARRYRALSPRPQRTLSDQEVSFLAASAGLCDACGSVKASRGACGACGKLSHPRVAVAFVVLLALGTVAMLVAIWVRTGRM